MKKMFLLGVCMVCLVGCISPEVSPVESIDENTFKTVGGSNYVAVCIGLTAVNPAKYSGWAGDCPGCDIDAKGMYNLFVKEGYTTTLLLNSACTIGNVRNTLIYAAKNLKDNDLLVIAMSGHGGQERDYNGDEADGMDETMCLWDGQLIDDEMLLIIRQFPNIRLVLINDQCHSEGNFRAVLRDAQQAVSFGYWGEQKAELMVDKGEWNGQLIQFAGCREANYSYGSIVGGTWSQSLLRCIQTQNGLTWVGWFEAANSIMPANQVPVYSEFGSVQNYFRQLPALK